VKHLSQQHTYLLLKRVSSQPSSARTVQKIKKKEGKEKKKKKFCNVPGGRKREKKKGKKKKNTPRVACSCKPNPPKNRPNPSSTFPSLPRWGRSKKGGEKKKGKKTLLPHASFTSLLSRGGPGGRKGKREKKRKRKEGRGHSPAPGVERFILFSTASKTEEKKKKKRKEGTATYYLEEPSFSHFLSRRFSGRGRKGGEDKTEPKDLSLFSV